MDISNDSAFTTTIKWRVSSYYVQSLAMGFLITDIEAINIHVYLLILKKAFLFMKVLRWIFFIPTGIISGFLVFYLFLLLENVIVTFYMFGGGKFVSGEHMTMVYYAVGGLLSGITTSYVSAYIAPCCLKTVAVIISSLTIVALAFTIPLLVNDSLTDLVIYAAQNIGILTMAWFIFREKVTFRNHL
jgi:hypothetical protein